MAIRDTRDAQQAWAAIVPNRLADVQAICAAHPEAFPPGDGNDPARLTLLTETMVPTINRDHPEDKGHWGVLTKTDQNNKIPCDVMVWRPGAVTVDVMTGTGASWQVQGSAPPQWVWTPCGADAGSGGGDSGGDSGGVGAPYDDAKSVEFGTACNEVYVESGAPIDPGMISVHSQRCAYDYYVADMPWDECLEKHVNEFRQVYGLPPV